MHLTGPAALVDAETAAVLLDLLAGRLRRAQLYGERLTEVERRVVTALVALARSARTLDPDPIGPDRTRSDGPTGTMRAEMTVAAAATVVGCSERHVRRLIARGVIGGRQVRGRWLVDREDVASYAAHRKEEP